MIVRLRREEFNDCDLWVLETKLRIKDFQKSLKEKEFASKAEALAEAEKFINRRLKTGSWKLLSRTDDDYYFNQIKEVQLLVSRESKLRGYDKIDCYLLQSQPAKFSDFERLAERIGGRQEQIPQTYRDFLMTTDGFMINYYVQKNGCGNLLQLAFLSSSSSAVLGKVELDYALLRSIQEPFIVVSIFNYEYERDYFTGGVLSLIDGAVRKYEGDVLVQQFANFKDYFIYEVRELGSTFFAARYKLDPEAELP